MVLYLAAQFLAIILSSKAHQIGSNLLNDLDAAKLGTSQLEAVLKTTTQKVDAKTFYLKEREKLIQDAESQVLGMQSVSFRFEVGLVLELKKALESSSTDEEDVIGQHS